MGGSAQGLSGKGAQMEVVLCRKEKKVKAKKGEEVHKKEN